MTIIRPYALKQLIMNAETVTRSAIYATDKCLDDTFEDPEEPSPAPLDQHMPQSLKTRMMPTITSQKSGNNYLNLKDRQRSLERRSSSKSKYSSQY